MAPDPELTAKVMKLRWKKGISLAEAWASVKKPKKKTSDKKKDDKPRKKTTDKKKTSDKTKKKTSDKPNKKEKKK
jgi:hypothetical protein